MKKILLLVAAMVSAISVGCKAELFGTRTADVTIINKSDDAVYASGKNGGDITVQAGEEGTVTLELREPSRHKAVLGIRAFSPQVTVLHITGNDIDTQDITIKEGHTRDITVSSKGGEDRSERKGKKRSRDEDQDEDRPKKKKQKNQDEERKTSRDEDRDEDRD